MKIAFIDTKSKKLKKLQKIICGYYESQNITAEADLYENPFDLIEQLKNNKGYQIIFINITCSEINGFDISANGIIPQIRHCNPFLPIIFTNCISDELIECIFIHPQRFMLNPQQKEEIFPMMNSISEQILYSPIRTIYIKTADKNNRMISVNDIIYAEVLDHTITIHLYGGETVAFSGTMKKLKQQLSDYPEFLTPHRSFIVNSIFISHISVKEICLKTSDVKIPVAKGKAEIIKEEYHEFFSKYQVFPYSAELKMAEVDF